ncbi:MAG: dephospho-CoA kinase [Ancrocorticia sp.]|uniref:dephospho-CoA kinase n=1 Tax=Ancrocorticia sp. TaxID=2593684 RepID=UPI003F8DC4C9
MLLISLTGGIGTGKSTAASLLRQRGAHILELDEVARTILDPGTSATWEVGELWPQVVRDGVVDRTALAGIVFNDREALAKLNAITHPRTWQAAERLLERWSAEDRDGVAVIEIAILADSPRRYGSHLNVVLGADTDVRIARLASRGLDAEGAQARIANQRPQSDLVELADAWLDNSGTLNDLASQISALWEDRLAPYARNLVRGVRLTGATRPAERAECERCRERLAHHGVRAAHGADSGELIAVDGPDGPNGASNEAALAAAGFVPGEGCFEVADPAYRLRIR